MDDVSSCAANGGSEEDIEVIVSKATDSIEATIDQVSEDTKWTGADVTASEKINATLEWATGMVIQGSTQVQAIGVQAVAAGHASVTSIREQMVPLVEANATQIETALNSCDVSITIEVDETEKVNLIS